MAAALRRNPRSLLRLLRNPFSSLSAAASPEIEAPPTATSPEIETPPAAASPEIEAPPAAASPEIEAHPAASATNTVTRLKISIRADPDPVRLAALFQSTAQQKRFRFDPNLYKLTVQKLARAGRHDLIDRLLDHSASDPAAPQSDGFLARIINLYSSARMFDEAVRTFDRAVAAGRTIGDLSFCALLNSLLKAGRFELAVEAFHRVPIQLNITPGLVPHNIVLQVLCKMGDVNAARKVLDEMANKDYGKPDIVSYTTVLEGHFSKGDEAGFYEILKEIDAKGLSATVITYNCRIMAFCLKEEMFKAEELLDVMAAKKVQPNHASFKNIIEGFYKVGDMESALRIFKRMKVMQTMTNTKDLLPDADTYNMLIKGFLKKKEFGSALEVCKECLARKLIPPFEPVKELAVGLRENAKVDEAKDIVERMRALLNDGRLEAWEKVSELSLPGQ